MKEKNFIFDLIILSIFCVFVLSADDTCPTTMRKTYADNTNLVQYGSARKDIGAIAFFEWPGSLFFNRKILIEPRFEVHLKVAADPVKVIEKQREQRLAGFSIVISGNKNTISGFESRSFTGDIDTRIIPEIGYSNFINSLIVEFDFQKDSYDPDTSSYSVRFCKSSCSLDDKIAMKSGKLLNQRYDPSKKSVWDFRLIYSNQKLSLYSGPNDLLYSTAFNLEANLGTNIAFVGFTGAMENNRRELSLIGTFICEDNFYISKMPGNFYLSGKLMDSTSYEAGSQIKYAFSFINNKGQTVPHAYGYGIWSYNFGITSDCGETSTTIAKDSNYTLILTTKACTKVGKHSINIKENKKGNAPVRYYTVTPGPMKIIKLVGHDGKIANVPSKTLSGNVLYLTYGDNKEGDFIMKTNLKLILDFDITDQYGNAATVSSPASLFSFLKVNTNGGTSNVASSVISYTVKQVNNRYQMTISVSKIGMYQIKQNSYMSQAIRFNVVPGEPDLEKSYCTLEKYTSTPTLNPNTLVTYNCYLKDSFGNDITTKNMLNNPTHTFSCQAERITPSSKTYSASFADKNTYYSCSYTTNDAGNFKMNGYLKKQGTKTNSQIKPKINQFFVRGDANNLYMKNILNVYNNKWLSISGAELTYTPGTDKLLAAVDFAESVSGTLMSSYGSYPSNFKESYVEAELINNHDTSFKFGNLITQFVTLSKKKYIGIYTEKSTDQVVKKSSFHYSIKITYKVEKKIIEEKTVTLKYIINIGSYTTCFHNLKESNTYLDQSNTIQLITKEAEKKIAKIELKTTDNYLYNYYIGKGNIHYNLSPSTSSITFRIVPLSILGTYEVYAKSTADYKGTLTVKINSVTIKTLDIVSKASSACILEFKDSSLFKAISSSGKNYYYNYTGTFKNGNLDFYFKMKDKYGNYIKETDYFSASASLTSENFKVDSSKYTIIYNTGVGAYQFTDNLPFQNMQYSWGFSMNDKSCNNKYYIRYDGLRGGKPVSLEYSYFNLLDDEININEIAYVDVFYKDINNEFMGLQKGELEKLKPLTTVKGNQNNVTIKFDFDSITSKYALRYKKTFTIAGKFKISATYNSSVIDSWKTVKARLTNDFDILYLVDATGSMQKEITAAKEQVIQIAKDLKAKYPEFSFKFGAIFYRDQVENSKEKNELFQLTDNIETLKNNIATVKASGGKLIPEDWVTAYKLSIENINWRQGTRLIIHIADAGGHGAEYSNNDKFYNEGPKMIPLIKNCVEMGIKIIGFKIGSSPTKSFNKVAELYNKYKASAKDVGQFIKIYEFKRGSDEEISNLFRSLVIQAADEAAPSSDTLTVIDNRYSLPHSKLQMVLNTVVDMNTKATTTIDNLVQTPSYKLTFYSATGVKTTYDKDSSFTCNMIGSSVDMQLNVAYKTDYVLFTYKTNYPVSFKNLARGNYQLKVADKKNNVIYPLFLLGDGTSDSSNEVNYNINKTVVSPKSINGIAGKTYKIEVEFRCSDGLRWNYVVDPKLFTFNNSFELNSSELITKVEKGYKKGQAIISVTQKIATNNLENELTIIYNGEAAPQHVSLKIKCDKLSKLVKVNFKDGDVITPPIITFRPEDVYGNLYTDLFTTSVTQQYLNSLTKGKSSDGIALTTNVYREDNQYLQVQYKSTVCTYVTVTSSYYKEGSIYYRIRSGPIDTTKSYAELKSTKTYEVGNKYYIIIYPKDKYNNNIDILDEAKMSNFNNYYTIKGVSGNNNADQCNLLKESELKSLRGLAESEDLNDNIAISCASTIKKTGTITFHVKYTSKEIKCNNCELKIVSNTIDFTKTKTYYKNKKIYLSTSATNEIEGKVEPEFELTFFDKYDNQMESSIVQKYQVTPELRETDILLCITNSGNKKIVTICGDKNGDDNKNKWQYIVNGNNYKLFLISKSNGNIQYPLNIIGGWKEGSVKNPDFSKTSFDPETITVEAGVEGKTTMEIKASDGKRKNYWYPSPSDKIKIEFDKNKDTCSYKIEKGKDPGQYVIKVTCKIVITDNYFSVTIESTKLSKKIKVNVNPGPAYYLEVLNTTLFSVSSNKYTWKTNPTNDDKISFNFKLKDQYQNYINSKDGKNQITINSETYGKNTEYYSLEYQTQQKNFLFTDNITKAITKHVWKIICTKSNKMYSFIYTKVAGKPDTSNSYWTIDKTNYIANEKSIVLVTLKDKLGVEVGTVKGKLDKEQGNVKVITTKKSVEKKYAYNSIKTNSLEYKYNYTEIGDYKVTVKYNNVIIKPEKSIKVAYQEIDLTKSKLYYDIGDKAEVLMLTTENTNIKNKEEYPSFKFYLYDSDGGIITTYDKSKTVTCKMTINSFEKQLIVTKFDSYFIFKFEDSYKESFSKLPLGLYTLHITVDKKVIKYPVYLLGDANVSPYQNYDITKTFIKPTVVNGVAGKQNEISIEFRAKDNLRWNYQINLNSFTISNSYKLNSKDLQIEKKLGDKPGQMKLIVTQNIASTNNKDNVLSFVYRSDKIKQTVTLKIKAGDLKTLEYVSGYADGTVVNPSILKFIPKDAYGNICTKVFDSKEFTKDKLNGLTKGESIEKHPLTANNYVSDGKYLNVKYSCEKVTTIKLTLGTYNTNKYTYKLWSGPINPDNSFAQMKKTDKVVAGEINTLIIYPKDIYNNNVTNITNSDVGLLDVDYEINKDYSVDISKSCKSNSQKSGSFIEIQFSCEANITKAGNSTFTVNYNDKPINCKNCQYIINPDVIDFMKTKVFNQNDNKEMSNTQVNVLQVSTNPNFLLNFFDKFMNPVTNKNEVMALQVKTELVVSDVKLCLKENNLYKVYNVCKSNGDENEERFKYLPNGDKYKLVVTNTKISSQSLQFPVKITGGYKDGEPGPIDPLKTYISPTKITLTAGVAGSISLELRTKDNKRKNYWYINPENFIKFEFPKSVTKCMYSFERAGKPGQYSIIFNCTKKENTFTTSVKVENVAIKTKISITVVPGPIAYSKLYKISDRKVEITNANLGSVSVEDKFQLVNRLYDQFDNLITNFDFELTTLLIALAPVNTVKSFTYSAELVGEKTGDIIITLKSTYAGVHTLTGQYFPKDYQITFTHGQPDADMSILEVSKTEAWVAEEIKIYITPYDKYNNYIDANEYKTTSPYQVKYSNDGSAIQVIKSAHSIEKKDDKNVLSYPGTFTIKGTTTVYGYIDTKQIKCVSCIINIKSRDIDFMSNYALRYENSKKEFELLQDGAVEKNTKEEPIYRLYPRDKYKNNIDVIPEETLKKYSAYLKSQSEAVTYNLKLNNIEYTNQEYAEFVINDIEGSSVKYSVLGEGFYDLVFTDGKDSLIYNISLTGIGNGGSNEEEDFQKTAILEQNLKYLAGNTGYMIVEIRTKSGKRKNYWDYTFKVESCDGTDKTFNVSTEKAGLLGDFLITVTTQKSNMFPNITKCPLKISVNNVLVKKLSPEMEVSPNVVVKTEILKKYYKDYANNILNDGTAGLNYEFEVESHDEYGNLAETIQDVVGLKVALQGGDEVKEILSETSVVTGSRKYIYTITKAGKYIANTEKTGPKGFYMAKEATFIVNPGPIDLSKTEIKEKETPILAGTAPAISLFAYDKYGNQLDYNNYINLFKAVFTDSNNTEHDSNGSYDTKLKGVYYTSKTPVTIVGNVNVEVTYNGKDKLDTSKVIIEVIPGDPWPENSILSREISEGTFTQYKNGENFTVDVNELLILNVTIYDKYNNLISNIPADVSIISPIMSGNDMEEIQFTVMQNTDYFGLNFNENVNSVYIYKHLVGGIYNLTYTVKASTGQKDFRYEIIIPGGDGKHGNGPYDLAKSTITPTTLELVAGNYALYTIELRTTKGLLYNDEIDIENDLVVEPLKKDASFNYTRFKAGEELGIYNIQIYSHIKGEYELNVKLTDLKDSSKAKKLLKKVKYKVSPENIPDKDYTVILSRPSEKVNPDLSLDITFTLADRFNNQFEGRNDIINNQYLTLINNDQPLSVLGWSLAKDKVTFKVSLYPKYPPSKMSMNILYKEKEEDTGVYCFPDNINISIYTYIDFAQTQIVSPNSQKIKVGEILQMWLYTFDKKGECFNEDSSSYFKITVIGPLESSLQTTKTYAVRYNNKPDSECNNEHEIITTDADIYKYAGKYFIKVEAQNTLIAQFDQECSPLGYDINGFLLKYSFDPNKISILDTVTFTVSGADMYGNKLTEELLNNLTIGFTKDDKETTKVESSKVEKEVGTVEFTVAIREIGLHQLHLYFNGEEVTKVNGDQKLQIFTIVTGPCTAQDNSHFDLSPLEDVGVNENAFFKFHCYDAYNNSISQGGEKFTAIAKVIYNKNEIEVEAEVVDDGKGSYSVHFIPEYQGVYIFNLLIGKEKYGEEFVWALSTKVCEGETPVLCPNVKKCVKKQIECIEPQNDCGEERPFKCLVNGEYTCVKSQTDCDCPDGYEKCETTNYCVKTARKDMCPFFLINHRVCVTKYGNGYKMFSDGICRLANSNPPNKRVCPIGKVLCPDLSCRNNMDECSETEKSEGNQIRCLDQSIVSEADKCPSTITCKNKDDVVCPDGTCVPNEIYCLGLKQCSKDEPYLCQNNKCAADQKSCLPNVSCGHKKSLCTDYICREEC